jgi:hypothetical protein
MMTRFLSKITSDWITLDILGDDSDRQRYLSFKRC